MPWVRRIFHLLPARADRLDEETSHELRLHVELWIEHLVSRGLTHEDAEHRARARFGDYDRAVSQLKASARARDRRLRRRESLAAWREDARHAVRRTMREWRLTTIIVGILALAIGANAAIVGVAYQFLFAAPSEIPDAQRVFRVWMQDGAENGSYFTSYPVATALASAATRSKVAGYTAPVVKTFESATDLGTMRVSGAEPALFEVSDVPPEAGHYYDRAMDEPRTARRVVVVTHAFSAAHGLRVKDSIRIGRELFTVVAVAPKGFTGAEIDAVDGWIPLRHALDMDWGDQPTDAAFAIVRVVGRLRPGVSRVAAERETRALYERILSSHHVPPDVTELSLTSIIPRYARDAPQMTKLVMVIGSVAIIVLMVGCTNVATLVASRAIRRRRDIDIHRFLGAGEGRVLRQCSIESMLIASLALVVGLVVAFGVRRSMYRYLLPGLDSEQLPGHAGVGVLILAPLVVALTTIPPLLVVLSPARAAAFRKLRWRTRRDPINRPVLVGAQLALAVAMMVAAMLFVRSLRQVNKIRTGFDVDHVVAARISLPPGTPSQGVLHFWSEVEHRLRRETIVRGVALATASPFGDYQATPLRLTGDGDRELPSEASVIAIGVDSAYASTLGLQMRSGRFIGARDTATSRAVVVINDEVARAGWRDGRVPDGATIRIYATDREVTVIGVAANVTDRWILDSPRREIYVPLSQWPYPIVSPDGSGICMLVRFDGDAAVVSDAIRRAAHDANPSGSQPLVKPLRSLLDVQRHQWIVGTRLLVPLSTLALMVALLGLYGLAEYSVTARKHEWSIRMAMGASPQDVVVHIYAFGCRLAMAGIGAGLLLAALVTPRIESLLFGVRRYDPVTFAGIAVAACVLASLTLTGPAHRAASSEPMVALRAE